jgi:hypothetical protein
MMIVRGDFINGSSVIFKKEGDTLIQGLEFADGSQRWLDYEWIDLFHEDRAVVCDGENMGYINRWGEECIPIIYAHVTEFSEGRAFAIKEEQTLLINREGKTICAYDDTLLTEKYMNGTTVISRVSADAEKIQDAIVDLQGHFVVNFAPHRKFDPTSRLNEESELPIWHEGVFYFYKRRRRILIDKNENILILNKYQY